MHQTLPLRMMTQAGGRAEQSQGSGSDASGGDAPASPPTPRTKEARPASLSAAKGIAEKLMQGKQTAPTAAASR